MHNRRRKSGDRCPSPLRSSSTTAASAIRVAVKLRVIAEAVMAKVRIGVEEPGREAAGGFGGCEVLECAETPLSEVAVNSPEVGSVRFARFNELSIIGETDNAARPDFEAVEVVDGEHPLGRVGRGGARG